jgi:hypothetical protein
MSEKLSVQIESFVPRVSNTLIGFATVVVPEMRLRIHDLTIHRKGEAKWCALPAKPQIGRDGSVRRDDNGKVLYSPILEFTDRETRDAFSKRVVEALEKFAPQAFDENSEQTAA